MRRKRVESYPPRLLRDGTPFPFHQKVLIEDADQAAGTIFQLFALETTGGHGASTKAVYYLFNKHLRDSGVPGEALKRKLNKDISFALRRGTIAQVTTLLPALDRRATSPPSAPPRQSSPSTRWVWHGKKLLVMTRRALSYCVGITENPLPLPC
jgi:hypothetical protein